MTCSKCGAGRAALYRTSSYLQNGVKIEGIGCRLCGEVVSMEATNGAPPMRDLTIRFPTKGTADYRPKTKGAPTEMVPCKVRGCSGIRAKHGNKSGFCSSCGANMRRWESGLKTTPPPFIQQDGQWIENPKRIRRK